MLSLFWVTLDSITYYSHCSIPLKKVQILTDSALDYMPCHGSYLNMQFATDPLLYSAYLLLANCRQNLA